LIKIKKSVLKYVISNFVKPKYLNATVLAQIAWKLLCNTMEYQIAEVSLIKKNASK
jgi:hypothetical protein